MNRRSDAISAAVDDDMGWFALSQKFGYPFGFQLLPVTGSDDTYFGRLYFTLSVNISKNKKVLTA